jgi:hypothetical protein
MTNIDERKTQKLVEAASWIEQARKHYAAWMWEVGDSCVVRAKAALDDDCFKRQPIPGMGRQLPETVKVKAAHLPQGYMILNGTDYDSSIHQIWEETMPSSAKRNK